MKFRLIPLPYTSATGSRRRAGIFGLLLFAAGAPALAPAGPARLTHVRQTPPPVENGSAERVAHLNPAQLLRLSLRLESRHVEEERKFLEELQTKGSPEYHHFLSAEEWARRFGPSEKDEQAVVDWAKSQGLTVTRRFPNRLAIAAEGPVSTVEHAFHITINLYQLGGKTFFSTDRDPEIPSSLAGIIQSVGGLDNLQVLHPLGKTE